MKTLVDKAAKRLHGFTAARQTPRKRALADQTAAAEQKAHLLARIGRGRSDERVQPGCGLQRAVSGPQLPKTFEPQLLTRHGLFFSSRRRLIATPRDAEQDLVSAPFDKGDGIRQKRFAVRRR